MMKNELCYIRKANKDLIELWHQLYGHLGYDNLKLLKDREMVNSMDVDTKKMLIKTAKDVQWEKNIVSLSRRKRRILQPDSLI